MEVYDFQLADLVLNLFILSSYFDFLWTSLCSSLGLLCSSSFLSLNFITSGAQMKLKCFLKELSIRCLKAKLALSLWFTNAMKVGASMSVCVM